MTAKLHPDSVSVFMARQDCWHFSWVVGLWSLQYLYSSSVERCVSFTAFNQILVGSRQSHFTSQKKRTENKGSMFTSPIRCQQSVSMVEEIADGQ